MPHRPLLLLIPIIAAIITPTAASFDPSDSYTVRQVLGWTVRINQRLLDEDPQLAEKTLTLLEHQLFKVERRLPAPAVERLRQVPIWVELKDRRFPCMCYHPSANWLRDNGYNPEKAGSVELANAANFLDWTIEQPYMVMHELAHAYHHQVLPGGHDNARVRAAYDAAVASGRYEKVMRICGKEVRHYALNNPMEYFAELTEAYFGTNDYYPFVRGELKAFDPEGYAMIQALWTNPHGKDDAE